VIRARISPLLALASLSLASPALIPPLVAPLSAQAVAITGATIHPVSGPRIEHGTIVVRDGRIVAVGADVAVPAGATRIDAAGKVVTPGLIHSSTDLGIALFESGGQEETREGTRQGDINASFNVAEGVNPAAVTIPVARLQGITTALAVPGGSLIKGQAAMIDLDGQRAEDMLARSPAAMVFDLSQDAKGAGGGSRAGVLQRLREILRDAQEFPRRRDEFRQARTQPLAASAADLEALQPVLRGTLPALVVANRRSDIESALRIAREFKLKLIVFGAVEGWQVARELAEARVPVIVNPAVDRPSFDAPGARLDNVALLREAGVQVLIVPGGEGQNSRLRFAAGEAVRNGMTWDDALAAVTRAPAEAFGIADRYGTLEPGKVANLVVWSGDPFEFSSRAEHIFIRGREIERRSRQTDLRDRYRTLPPTY
jgi:imidazolonepropionase-like amidohydrolase